MLDLLWRQGQSFREADEAARMIELLASIDSRLQRIEVQREADDGDGDGKKADP
jgi:hypothetical protein